MAGPVTSRELAMYILILSRYAQQIRDRAVRYLECQNVEDAAECLRQADAYEDMVACYRDALAQRRIAADLREKETSGD